MVCTLTKQFIVSLFYCLVDIKNFWETPTGLGTLFSLFSNAEQHKANKVSIWKFCQCFFRSSADDMILAFFEIFEEKSSYPWVSFIFAMTAFLVPLLLFPSLYTSQESEDYTENRICLLVNYLLSKTSWININFFFLGFVGGNSP